VKADGPVTRDDALFRARLVTHTYVARALTKALPLTSLSRLEGGPMRHLVDHGAYRIPFGLGRGVLLDAASLTLSSAQARSVLRGLHEPQVCEALRRTLPVGGTLIDIGAHIGYVTMIGAGITGQAGTVIAVEPVPSNVVAIRRNATLNEFDHVQVIEAAASHSSGQEELITTSDTIWTRLASVGEHPGERERTRVRTVAVDDLVDSGDLALPDVVKIDVEGAEMDVLDGMRRTLAARRTTVICEMHGKNEQFVAAMDELGYRVTNLDGPDPITTAAGNDHALAQPR
jgi:FkbM family methyltransferase